MPLNARDHLNVSKTASQILAANLVALRDADPVLTSQGKIGAKSGMNQRTVGRIINMEHEPTFAQLTKLAKAFGLQPWQMLVPNLEPTNPPMLASESQSLRKLLTNIGSTKEALEGFLRSEGNTDHGTLD